MHYLRVITLFFFECAHDISFINKKVILLLCNWCSVHLFLTSKLINILFSITYYLDSNLSPSCWVTADDEADAILDLFTPRQCQVVTLVYYQRDWRVIPWFARNLIITVVNFFFTLECSKRCCCIGMPWPEAFLCKYKGIKVVLHCLLLGI